MLGILTVLIHEENVLASIIDSLVNFLNLLNSIGDASKTIVRTLTNLIMEPFSPLELQCQPTSVSQPNGCAFITSRCKLGKHSTRFLDFSLNPQNATISSTNTLRVMRVAEMTNRIVQSLSFQSHVAEPLRKTFPHLATVNLVFPNKATHMIICVIVSDRPMLFH